MTRWLAPLAAAFLLFAPAASRAQEPVPPAAPPAAAGVIDDSLSANATRQRLQQLLRQMPPSVGEVLQRDPSLMARPDYLAPYPALLAFLQQHPEVVRNPEFFIGRFQYYEPQPRDQAIEMFAVVLGGFGGMVALAIVLSVFIWLVRAVIEHRRWLRLSRVQAEVHAKVMDRLTTNEDLLAYVQTPAGRRFLESAPFEHAPRTHSAPVNSILWSLQGGVVLIALGIGLWSVQGNVIREVAEGLYVIGVVAAALGVGFVVSALMAYLISSRLGLVARTPADHA